MLDSKDLRRTVVIENVEPVVDGGRYPVKREVGTVLEVTADIFKEGHDVLARLPPYRRADEPTWRETPMRLVDNDRWAGAFPLDRQRALSLHDRGAGRRRSRSWLADFAKRVDAGQDVASELRRARRWCAAPPAAPPADAGRARRVGRAHRGRAGPARRRSASRRTPRWRR